MSQKEETPTVVFSEEATAHNSFNLAEASNADSDCACNWSDLFVFIFQETYYLLHKLKYLIICYNHIQFHPSTVSSGHKKTVSINEFELYWDFYYWILFSIFY